ncbi:energy transducer TonB [Desulfothermus sp.]
MMYKQFKSSWPVATSLALIINFLFIYLMCMMVTYSPKKVSYTSYVPSIDVVKVREKRYKHRMNKPPQRHKPHKVKTLRVKMNFQKNVTKRIRPFLPFKVNFKLPQSAGINIPEKFLLPPPPHVKGIYSIQELDNPLMPVVRLRPLYPMRARMLGIEGWVKVQFIVDEHGNTKDIKIIQAKPKGIFERSTIDAISKWKFKPPTVDGIPIRVIVETTIKYKLEQ